MRPAPTPTARPSRPRRAAGRAPAAAATPSGDDKPRAKRRVTKKAEEASAPQPPPPANPSRQASPDLLTALADAADARGEELAAPLWAGRRGGYTPFEMVGFSDEDVAHDVSVTVAAPRSTVYGIWADRANYGQWFSSIAQSVVHATDASLASYFFFYSHGTLPALELYTTLRRDLVPNEAVLERSVDGWDLAAAAFFADAPGGVTTVTLRLGYALPAQLDDAVGGVAVYGDVEERLRGDMAAMAAFCERHAADPGALAAKRAAEAAAVDAAHAARFDRPDDAVLDDVAGQTDDCLYDAEMVGGVEVRPAPAEPGEATVTPVVVD